MDCIHATGFPFNIFPERDKTKVAGCWILDTGYWILSNEKFGRLTFSVNLFTFFSPKIGGI